MLDAAMPMTMKERDKKGPMKMKGMRIKKLDDGTVLISCEYRDGNGHYEEKESSFQTAEEAGSAVRDFLKEGKGLVERRGKN